MKNKTLHVGLSLTEEQKKDSNIVHCPLIEIVPVSQEELEPVDLDRISYVIFTSKTAVELWCRYFGAESLQAKILISVGRATSRQLKGKGLHVDYTAEEESAEGVVKILDEICLAGTVVLWPHAAGARKVIADYCRERNIILVERILYYTLTRKPENVPDLEVFDKIYFSSPSSVEAFFALFPHPPPHLSFEAIGPVTEKKIWSAKALPSL